MPARDTSLCLYIYFTFSLSSATRQQQTKKKEEEKRGRERDDDDFLCVLFLSFLFVCPPLVNTSQDKDILLFQWKVSRIDRLFSFFLLFSFDAYHFFPLSCAIKQCYTYTTSLFDTTIISQFDFFFFFFFFLIKLWWIKSKLSFSQKQYT
jgi:hypothetical protein